MGSFKVPSGGAARWANGAVTIGVAKVTAVAAASTVGAMGSFTTLALAYREPLNRCRCDAATSERVEDDADEPEEPRDEARTKAKTKKQQSKSPFRAHCPK